MNVRRREEEGWGVSAYLFLIISSNECKHTTFRKSPKKHWIGFGWWAGKSRVLFKAKIIILSLYE